MGSPAIHSGDKPGGGLVWGLAGGSNCSTHFPSFVQPAQIESIGCKSTQGTCSCLKGHIASLQRPRCWKLLRYTKVEPSQSFFESVSFGVKHLYHKVKEDN